MFKLKALIVIDLQIYADSHNKLPQRLNVILMSCFETRNAQQADLINNWILIITSVILNSRCWN